ncbi:hypothetical protein [Parabacteroides gordonii]|uniref:hypothetical protein n=1 Tax=Parabacteroides gordonii TaxID=574930 RepID=UPI00241E4FAF|nr:hypothetical protein [Parabacteroides gordonii]
MQPTVSIFRKTTKRKSPIAIASWPLCAKVGYEAIADMMQRYYEEAIDAIPEDADRYEAVRRMRETVERIGGSILRRELEYYCSSR